MDDAAAMEMTFHFEKQVSYSLMEGGGEQRLRATISGQR